MKRRFVIKESYEMMGGKNLNTISFGWVFSQANAKIKSAVFPEFL